MKPEQLSVFLAGSEPHKVGSGDAHLGGHLLEHVERIDLQSQGETSVLCHNASIVHTLDAFATLFVQPTRKRVKLFKKGSRTYFLPSISAGAAVGTGASISRLDGADRALIASNVVLRAVADRRH
jgi:hypothetical protein